MRDSRTGGVAVVVALALALIAAFAVGAGVNTAWARRTLLDTDGFLEHISGPLLDDPAAKDALAHELTQQTLGSIDLNGGLVELVPFPLRVAASQLGDQVVADLEEQLEPAIRRQLDTPLVAQVWERASRELHDQLLDELSSGSKASTIRVDLHDVLVRAIHDIGTEVQQNHQAIPLVTEIFDGIGAILPPDVGVVPIDVSQVQGPARVAIANASSIEVAAFAIGLGAIVLALLASRRRGLTVLVFGVGLGAMALFGYGMFWFAFDGAGATVAAQSAGHVSADVQRIIDIQAELIVASYRPWALALGAAGVVVALVGAVWAAAGPAPQRRRDRDRGAPADDRPLATPVSAGWDMPSAPPTR